MNVLIHFFFNLASEFPCCWYTACISKKKKKENIFELARKHGPIILIFLSMKPFSMWKETTWPHSPTSSLPCLTHSPVCHFVGLPARVPATLNPTLPVHVPLRWPGFRLALRSWSQFSGMSPDPVKGHGSENNAKLQKRCGLADKNRVTLIS